MADPKFAAEQRVKMLPYGGEVGVVKLVKQPVHEGGSWFYNVLREGQGYLVGMGEDELEPVDA